MKPLIHSTLLLFCTGQMLLAGLSVKTRFSQPRVALGNPVQYIVEITASDSAAQPKLQPITSLPIPLADGLELRNGRNSSSSQTRIVNGKTEYRITQSAIIDVVPPSTGSFTIAAYQIEIDGQTLTAPAATLQVVENPADAAPTVNELAFLEVESPDKLYLGQSADLKLRLHIAENVRLSGIGNFESQADGFSMDQDPNKYNEDRILRDGREYRVLTWDINATALTAGPQSLDFQIEVSARMPGSSRSSSRSPFGRSLFDDFFEPAQRFPVYGKHTIEVLPLPEENRSPAFDGAVGKFSMEVFTDLQETTVGEPIMYSIRLAGEGNFDRIQAPELADSPDWKLYSPQAVQEESGEDGSAATKRFDYVMTPARAGSLKTPAVQFAYFDPARAAYVLLESPPIPVNVKPSDRAYLPPAPVAGKADGEAENRPLLSRPLTREEALTTLDYQPRKRTASPDALHPFHSKAFLALQTALLLLLSVAAILMRRHTVLNEDPRNALARAAQKASKQARAQALAATGAPEFYKAALASVRHAATARTRQDQSNATYHELHALLPGPENNPQAVEALQTLCLGADALQFSGKTQNANLEALRPLLDTVLRSL